MTTQTEQLASEFVAVLCEWLTPAEFAEMRMRNRANIGAPICASHDYCDSNVAMEVAFERIVGRESVMPSEGPQGYEDQELWDAAWTLARARYLTA
jgi:hypothetical protein